VLALNRGGLCCVANLSGAPAILPPGDLLLTSAPLDGGKLPPDTAAWLRL
jgi:alpha-glucosidase